MDDLIIIPPHFVDLLGTEHDFLWVFQWVS